MFNLLPPLGVTAVLLSLHVLRIYRQSGNTRGRTQCYQLLEEEKRGRRLKYRVTIILLQE